MAFAHTEASGRKLSCPTAYVIEVFGRTAGIVARDSQSNKFQFLFCGTPL